MAEYVRAFAPGRVEVAGNHCDHQHGCIVAAAVDLGVSAEARLNGTDSVNGESEGFAPFQVELSDLRPRQSQQGSPASLLRGVLQAFQMRGVQLRGFDVRFSSTVPPGSGLSSSAAFELACAVVANELFADGRFGAVELAKMGMYAECEHFGKPCGLMDQLASACGDIVEVDFYDPDDPVVMPVRFDLEDSGYALCLVDSRCDHSLYPEAFAAVPGDMRAVAQLFGEEALRHVSETAFMNDLPHVRRRLGDLAALRAMHFFAETRSVQMRAQALRKGDMETFLHLTNVSGVSSSEYLQNVSVPGPDQPAMVTLAVVRRALAGAGAARIHGGGFGGCIQAFVPNDGVDAFTSEVEGVLGAGVCQWLSLGHPGAHAWHVE